MVHDVSIDLLYQQKETAFLGGTQKAGGSAQPSAACRCPCWCRYTATEVTPPTNLLQVVGMQRRAKVFHLIKPCLLKNENKHFSGICTQIPSSCRGLVKPQRSRSHQVLRLHASLVDSTDLGLFNSLFLASPPLTSLFSPPSF